MGAASSERVVGDGGDAGTTGASGVVPFAEAKAGVVERMSMAFLAVRWLRKRFPRAEVALLFLRTWIGGCPIVGGGVVRRRAVVVGEG